MVRRRAKYSALQALQQLQNLDFVDSDGEENGEEIDETVDTNDDQVAQANEEDSSSSDEESDDPIASNSTENEGENTTYLYFVISILFLIHVFFRCYVSRSRQRWNILGKDAIGESASGRYQAVNILRRWAGPTAFATAHISNDDPLSAFRVLFSENLVRCL